MPAETVHKGLSVSPTWRVVWMTPARFADAMGISQSSKTFYREHPDRQQIRKIASDAAFCNADEMAGLSGDREYVISQDDLLMNVAKAMQTRPA